jgi:hypothetical protein
MYNFFQSKNIYYAIGVIKHLTDSNSIFRYLEFKIVCRVVCNQWQPGSSAEKKSLCTLFVFNC